MVDPSLFPESAKFCTMNVANHSTDLTRFNMLHPLERALVAHAVDIRKAEFGDARWCAHQALADLGRDSSQPILRGERGMPLWPSAVSGSLTHTNGFRAAVVAPRLLVRSTGRRAAWSVDRRAVRSTGRRAARSVDRRDWVSADRRAARSADSTDRTDWGTLVPPGAGNQVAEVDTGRSYAQAFLWKTTHNCSGSGG